MARFLQHFILIDNIYLFFLLYHVSQLTSRSFAMFKLLRVLTMFYKVLVVMYLEGNSNGHFFKGQ